MNHICSQDNSQELTYMLEMVHSVQHWCLKDMWVLKILYGDNYTLILTLTVGEVMWDIP